MVCSPDRLGMAESPPSRVTMSPTSLSLCCSTRRRMTTGRTTSPVQKRSASANWQQQSQLRRVDAVRYHAETMEEAYASRAHYGAPRFEVDGWVSGYVAIANGELEGVSEDVPLLTGHPATSLGDFLRVHPESYAHLL